MAEALTEALTAVILADAPPGVVIVGTSIAPEQRRAAALTFLPTANYLMDNLFEYVDGVWHNQEGGSGGPGINWSGSDIGVLRFSDEAPRDAQTVVIRYEGRDHRVPVRHGYFLFVVWDTALSEDPVLVGFE
jgi:hypothetical protein